MEKVYSRMGLSIVPDIKIRFGQEKSINGAWKKIIATNDIDKRKSQIDNLLELIETNTEYNGFFGRNDKVDCGAGHAFLLNDNELYYMFFNNLKILNEQNIDGKVTDGSITNQAIKATILQYAGGNGINRQLRFNNTTIEIKDDGIEIPSISKQKGKNCFYCTEKAAIAHNLWLLTGVTSYFCLTCSDNFGHLDPQYKNDSHNFTIVEYDDKFRLYDLALDNYCMLEKNCIDSLLTGKGLEVKGVRNPGVYAKNYSKEK